MNNTLNISRLVTLAYVTVVTTPLLVGCAKKDVVSPVVSVADSETVLANKIGISSFSNPNKKEIENIIKYLDTCTKQEKTNIFKLLGEPARTRQAAIESAKSKSAKSTNTSNTTARTTSEEDEPPMPYAYDSYGTDPDGNTQPYNNSWYGDFYGYYQWLVAENSFHIYKIVSRESLNASQTAGYGAYNSYQLNYVQHLGSQLLGFYSLASWTEVNNSNYYGRTVATFFVAGDVSLKAYRFSIQNRAYVDVSTVLNTFGSTRN